VAPAVAGFAVLPELISPQLAAFARRHRIVLLSPFAVDRGAAGCGTQKASVNLLRAKHAPRKTAPMHSFTVAPLNCRGNSTAAGGSERDIVTARLESCSVSTLLTLRHVLELSKQGLEVFQNAAVGRLLVAIVFKTPLTIS
jgi:hypothetical protein